MGNKRACSVLHAGRGASAVDGQNKVDKAAAAAAAAAKQAEAQAGAEHQLAALSNGFRHAIQLAVAASPYLAPDADVGKVADALGRVLSGAGWGDVLAAGRAQPALLLVRPEVAWRGCGV